MIQRLQAPVLRRQLELFPAVALLGPRQAGKTSLALQIGRELPSLYLDLEASADRARLAEPALFLERHGERLVIFDEVQRLPVLFADLRGQDQREQAAQGGGGSDDPGRPGDAINRQPARQARLLPPWHGPFWR